VDESFTNPFTSEYLNTAKNSKEKGNKTSVKPSPLQLFLHEFHKE
jgi:hypothetical protein